MYKERTNKTYIVFRRKKEFGRKTKLHKEMFQVAGLEAAVINCKESPYKGDNDYRVFDFFGMPFNRQTKEGRYDFKFIIGPVRLWPGPLICAVHALGEIIAFRALLSNS